MKTKLYSGLLLVSLWTGIPHGWADDEVDLGDFLMGCQLSSTALPVPNPSGTNSLNCLLPFNGGGYVAVWDTVDSSIVERRAADGTQVWVWTPPTPLPVERELARVVLYSKTHTLWCSTMRWYFLDNTNGVPARAGQWSLPYLDPSRTVIQNDRLYVLYGSNASIYSTNMEFQGTISVDIPEGYWQSHAGSWLVDLGSRTTHGIRLATLGADLAVGAPFEAPLPTHRTGGYVDHRVLEATAGSIFVVSSVYWSSPPETRHYFTLVSSAGAVLSQHRLDCNQIITGSAVSPDGWWLSAQFLAEAAPRHMIFRVDPAGRPFWQVIIDRSAPKNYRLLNTDPPQVVELRDGSNLSIRPVVLVSAFDVLSSIIWPAVQWSVNPPRVPRASTDYFWITPIRFNNS